MSMLSVLSLILIASAPHKVLIVGDSLTAGYGVKATEAYPHHLEQALRAEGISIEVLNGGVSGDTTAGGLRRLPWMLKQAKPDIVIIALGGNDMLRGLPTQTTQTNLQKMIELSEAQGSTVIVFGIPASGTLGRQYTESFDRIFASLEREYKVPVFANFLGPVAGNLKLNLPDGIHPSAEGHKIIAQNVQKFIEPWIKKLNAKN